MEKSEALGEIARMIGNDLSGAREYCSTIQKLCQPCPSFASIADALACFDLETATIQQIAELASQIHMGLMVAVDIEYPVHAAEERDRDEREECDEEEISLPSFTFSLRSAHPAFNFSEFPAVATSAVISRRHSQQAQEPALQRTQFRR
ncbi:hypothetical protein ACYOEI_17685, partial [Singulisphaera rosea]